MAEQPESYFTLVFEGDIRELSENPFNVATPFGLPFAAGVGDALADRAAADVVDDLVAALELMLDHGERCNWFADRGDEEVCDYARKAIAKAKDD